MARDAADGVGGAFLLRAAHLKPGQRALDAAPGTGIAAEAALAGGRRCAPDVAPHLGS